MAKEAKMTEKVFEKRLLQGKKSWLMKACILGCIYTPGQNSGVTDSIFIQCHIKFIQPRIEF